MPEFTVIVPAYTMDRWRELTLCIDSLKQQTLKPHKIILVIDNNQEMFDRARQAFDNVTVLENKYLQGANGSRNTGVDQAEGDFVSFIDDDAIAEPDWLEKMHAEFVDESILGVGGHISPVWMGAEPRWLPEEFYWVFGCSYRGLPVKASPVRNLISCNMTIRRSVFDNIRFRNGIGHVGGKPAGDDETEFCIRLGEAYPAHKLIHSPLPEVHHHVPAKRTTFGYFRNRCWLEGQSKALLSRLVGTKNSTSSELDYTLKILPSGVLKGLFQPLKGDFHGLLRAVAIIAGFSITVLGYAKGTLLNAQPANDNAGLSGDLQVSEQQHTN